MVCNTYSHHKLLLSLKRGDLLRKATFTLHTAGDLCTYGSCQMINLLISVLKHDMSFRSMRADAT